MRISVRVERIHPRLVLIRQGTELALDVDFRVDHADQIRSA